MSYLDWHVGMKVVCVDAGTFTAFIQDGCVYTIRTMDAEWVYFEEPSTFGVGGPDMAGYRYKRFRPVEKRTTDISIFQSILLNLHVNITEDA